MALTSQQIFLYQDSKGDVLNLFQTKVEKEDMQK